MFSKTLRSSVLDDNSTIDFAVEDDGSRCCTLPSSEWCTEPESMIIGVAGKGKFFIRLNRDEVVQMARFFAEAASKMPV